MLWIQNVVEVLTISLGLWMGWIFKYLLPIYYSLNKVVMIQTQPNSTLKNDQNNVKRFEIIVIPLNLQNEGKRSYSPKKWKENKCI